VYDNTELTEDQMALLFECWCIHSRGMGLVVQPEELPDAHALAEMGWLERRVDHNLMSFWWTPMGEQALATGALISAEQDQSRRN
jgi:hypothetical protein